MRPQFTDLTNNHAETSEEESQDTSEENYQASVAYQNAMMCTRLAGKAIIRVVTRCNEAKENENLDLSSCQLMQIPDAVFHLMRHTNLKKCDISFNVITKIPPILASRFSLITVLNVSNNRISKLPEELVALTELTILDISHNSFISLPRFAYNLPKLEHLNAEKNYIAEIEEDRLLSAVCLKEVNLGENPLRPNCRAKLRRITKVNIVMSPNGDEDSWDSGSEEEEEERARVKPEKETAPPQ